MAQQLSHHEDGNRLARRRRSSVQMSQIQRHMNWGNIQMEDVDRPEVRAMLRRPFISLVLRLIESYRSL
jgi:hypothetical protein